MVVTNIIAFIILTLIFTGIEIFVKWEIKLIPIPVAMFFSAILIAVWNVL